MQTDTKYYASCSFGKDSIATILLALEHGEPLDGAIYVEVMFDNSRNISGDNPEAIGWIDEVAIPKLAELGCPTIKLRSEVDYVGYFHKRCTKGKREGKCHGFIYSIGCPLLRDCKLRPMRQFLKGKSVVQYVGIAIDEPQRLEALHKQKGRISLLEKYGYTEKMAMEKCREYGLVSPLYETSNRGGAGFAPNNLSNNWHCADRTTSTFGKNSLRSTIPCLTRTEFRRVSNSTTHSPRQSQRWIGGLKSKAFRH